jgi:ferric-dicitrate binding protein FerR (iron transport regulator)
MWNRALPIDGGTYTITARAPGAKEWSASVTVAPEADAKTVEIPELQLAAPIPVKPPTPARRRGLGLPIAVSAGAVALLGGALGFSLWGDSTYDEAKAEMTDQARRDSLEGSANRKRYAAEGFAVAGIGCAGVAVWLFIRQRGGGGEMSQAQARRLMLAPTPSGLGVVGKF